MTKGETMTGERDRAIAILKRAGWKMPAISRVLGKQEGLGDVDAKIERVAIELCTALAATDWQVSLDELRGRSSERRFAAPRGAAMWLARELVGASFPAIGAYFNRDHSTVISAWRPSGKWRRIGDTRLHGAVATVLARARKRAGK